MKLLDKELFSKIVENVTKGYIRFATHPFYPELRIFSYTDKTTIDGAWNEATLMCRGLVVNTDTLEVVIPCIPKFFNFNEPLAPPISMDNAQITLKEDGYLIQIRNHPKYGLLITSKGSFDSRYAKYVEEFYKSKLDLVGLEDYTFVCELCKDFPGDEGIIVTKHPKEELVVWACVDEDGNEHDLFEIVLPSSLRRVQSFTPDEAKEYLKGEVEGVVLKDENNQRVKMKTDWFLKMHRLISNCTKKRVFELFSENIPVSSIEGIPDEFMQQMLSWEKELKFRKKKEEERANELLEKYSSWEDKKLGIKQPEDSYSMSLLWAKRRGKDINPIILKNIGKNLGE